ncbi:serine protease inhibitor A3F-like [Mus pahari]|nr:serine protease inhibitor A3F-like [Mus pahari]
MIDELHLTKFSISTDYSLEHILPELGIRELFSTEADLSGITEIKDLSVFQVVHKAVLDVAETGTEAAAATGYKLHGCCLEIYSMIIYFNRPFLMVISDTNTHVVLLMAKVTNPERDENFPNGEGASSQELEIKPVCRSVCTCCLPCLTGQ